ncbi:MAG: YibE/F family protein [Erysipelotrichaceae bacterium]|nr:YibE/F family protein [Erysipelotrichaceae bacterium]
MKKTNRKASPNTESQTKIITFERSSILVLVISFALFIGALFMIYSQDILNGAGEIFTYQGNGIAEYETASVTEIINESVKAEEITDGALGGSQELKVTINSGRYKGEEMIVDNFFYPLNGVPAAKGDNVTLLIKTYEDGERYASVYEINRIPILAVFLLLFFLIVIKIGGLTGLKSLIGLIFTIICLFAILIPLLLKGAPTILTTFMMCAYIALVNFTILGGVHRKTISAFLGTVSGTFLALVFGMAVQYFCKIDGYRLEDAEPLYQLKYAGVPIHIQGLLTASIIICALGAVMDVAMSISSSLEEVHTADPAYSKTDLFRSGMNIGRDMVGTMTNTLILAFLGSEFTLIIFLYSRGLTFYHLFSTAFIVLETISGISSSIGMILAIPLTALISSTLIKKS